MSNHKPTPIELVTQHTERRSSSEATLQFLRASSYPHASFSTLVMATLHEHIDEEGRRHLSQQLIENERDYDLGTFIRCLQMETVGSRLSFNAKTYELEGRERRINDHPSNHKTVALVEADLEGVESIEFNKTLIDSFLYDVWLVVSRERRTRETTTDNVRWQCYKTTHATKATPTAASFNDIINVIKEAFLSGDSVVSFTTQSIVVSDMKRSLRWTFKRPVTVIG